MTLLVPPEAMSTHWTLTAEPKWVACQREKASANSRRMSEPWGEMMRRVGTSEADAASRLQAVRGSRTINRIEIAHGICPHFTRNLAGTMSGYDAGYVI